MKFTFSLKKNYQFKKIYSKGRPIANKNLVLYVIANNKNTNYLGISVSKKVGKSVIRSRVTRLIRESYRLNEDKIKKGYSMIFVARSSSSEINYEETKKSLLNLLKRHNIYIN